MRKELRRLTLLTCITATAALGGQAAFAGYGSPAEGFDAGCREQMKGKRGPERGHFKRMARELALTDQQKSAAKTLWEKGRDANRPLMEALRSERRQLHALIRSGNADEGAIRAQAAKVASVEADLAVRRGEQAKRFIALLTPEQAAKLKEIQGRRGCNNDYPPSEEP